jgi:class 3 adenylate cyclase
MTMTTGSDYASSEQVEQPRGTVTLVFTDIEGSTRLLTELGVSAYRHALKEHRACLREAFTRYRGYEVNVLGDGLFYAFSSEEDAVRAVRDAVACFEAGPIRIRVGVHTGRPELDAPDYVGLDVHKAARIMAAGHGGQVLLSETTRKAVSGTFDLRDLGEYQLKDISSAEHLYQLGPGKFPPLRAPRSAIERSTPRCVRANRRMGPFRPGGRSTPTSPPRRSPGSLHHGVDLQAGTAATTTLSR